MTQWQWQSAWQCGFGQADSSLKEMALAVSSRPEDGYPRSLDVLTHADTRSQRGVSVSNKLSSLRPSHRPASLCELNPNHPRGSLCSTNHGFDRDTVLDSAVDARIAWTRLLSSTQRFQLRHVCPASQPVSKTSTQPRLPSATGRDGFHARRTMKSLRGQAELQSVCCGQARSLPANGPVKRSKPK
ncbi:hypothetical protein BKA80DRAFT_50136 [Phyllosticta citrichinensis]